MAETKQKRKRVNLTLTKELHQIVKTWCASRGVTMQSGLEGMIERAFDKIEVRKAP
jgi:predicted DNA binding CopG/RHH family protein